SEYFENEKKPHNGSACRLACWPRNSSPVKHETKSTMKLPPDVEFHEDIRLLVHRPRGLLNKQVVNRLTMFIGELEHSLQEPFNRFFDAVDADAVDLNFK